ncbi:signal peptidase II [bacterium]|nr:signal peptidase II [bacterium]
MKWANSQQGLLPLGLAVALLAGVMDQVSKHWLLYGKGLINGRAYEVLPFFNLVMVWNHGVSFGLFASGSDNTRNTLLIVASLIVIVLTWALFRTRVRFLAVAMGLIIGGAIGNMIDRVRFGAVADFFDMHVNGYHWPAFNVADSCVCVGVALLLFDSLFLEPKRKQPVV